MRLPRLLCIPCARIILRAHRCAVSICILRSQLRPIGVRCKRKYDGRVNLHTHTHTAPHYAP